MKIFIILIVMLFLHTFYDFHLQGILAQMKQKEWWQKQFVKEELSNTKYRNDYKMALAVHSFEWAFCIQLPMLITAYPKWYGYEWFSIRSALIFIFLLIINACLHYLIDDMKANDRILSLVADQMIHVGQVTISWLLWLVIIGF